MNLNVERFALAAASVVGLVAFGAFTFWYSKELGAAFAPIITLLIRELGGGKSSAFSWFFDGSADKPTPTYPATTTINTKAP